MKIRVYEKGARDDEFYAYLGPHALKRRIPEEMHDAQYGGLYDEPYAVWFLALDGGRLLGFCALFDKEKEIFFDNCYVLPEHRGRGVGKALFAERMKYALRIRGQRKIRGITKNEIQYNLYRKHGFRLASKRGKYYWMELTPE